MSIIVGIDVATFPPDFQAKFQDAWGYDTPWMTLSGTTSAILPDNGSTNISVSIYSLTGQGGLPSGYEFTLSDGTNTMTTSSLSFSTLYAYQTGSGITLTLGYRAVSAATCFLGSAPVLTPSGYKRIDSLRVGDLVSVEGKEGRSIAITKVSVQRVSPSTASNPYRIPKGSFGATRSLLISPDHRVLVGGSLVAARDLGLKQEAQTAPFDYYNLELPGWANMIVAGVTVESLAPIKRLTVTMAQFAALLVKAHGANAQSAATLEHIKRTCKFLTDGRVDIPVMYHQAQKNSNDD